MLHVHAPAFAGPAAPAAVSLLAQTSGTWWNVAAVLLGGAIGLLSRGRLPQRIVDVIMQALGLVVLLIGVLNALELARVERPSGVIVGLLALVIGAALGEWWRIEEGLEALGDRLKRRFKGQGRFTEGFVSASLLFCVGPLALIGSLQNGLTGDDSFLILKSGLDLIAAVALATSFGVGVLASVLVIALYQGGLSLAAGLFADLIPNPATDPQVLLLTGVGGLMIVGIGLILLDIKRVRVASMLPAFALALLFYRIGVWLLR
jgi:uncharacterized membrane protein YqgA involved in biofilm formation